LSAEGGGGKVTNACQGKKKERKEGGEGHNDFKEVKWGSVWRSVRAKQNKP